MLLNWDIPLFAVPKDLEKVALTKAPIPNEIPIDFIFPPNKKTTYQIMISGLYFLIIL